MVLFPTANWGYLKDMLADLRVFSASQGAKEQAKDQIRAEIVAEGCKRHTKHLIDGYHEKLLLVQRHQGNNNFRG
jgi:hypothetical protein